MKLKRFFTTSLLFFILLTSLPANALLITFVGTENIMEKVDFGEGDVVQGQEDVLFYKKEPKVIGKREVIKGICSSGQRVKVFQTKNGWVADGPNPVHNATSLPPTDIAFLACGETASTFSRITKHNTDFVNPFTNSIILPISNHVQTPMEKTLGDANNSSCESSLSDMTMSCITKKIKTFFNF